MKCSVLRRGLYVIFVVFLLLSFTACVAAPAPSATNPEATSASLAKESAPAAEVPTTEAEQTAETSSATGASAASTFIMCVNNQPKNVDPHVGSSNPEQEIQTAAYETLLTYEPGSFELKPSLATEWQYNDDFTQLTLKIRENVKFHDGSTLDAEAVKAGLERSITIGQGESFFLAPVDTIEAPDANTVVIHLKAPSPEFHLGLTRIFIPSKQAVQEHEVDGDLAQNWFAENTDGTGPYMMTEWIKGQSITLSRFDDYWQGWAGNHESEYQLRVVAEPATQRLLLEQGECDYADSITREDAKTLSSNPDIKVEVHTAPSPFYIAMNTQKGPLADVKVREAMQYALDYQTVIDQAMSGYASLALSALPDSFPQHLENLPKPEYNLDKAAALLKEAGYEPGQLELTFMYLEPWVHEKNTGLILQSSLAEIGVKLNLEPQPWATIVERHANPETRPDMSMYTVYAPTPSPHSIFYPMFHSGSNHWSYFGYNNPEVDKLLDQVPTIIDKTERDAAYKKLQQLIYDDHPAIYAFQENEIQVFRSNVQNYEFKPSWNKLLNYYSLYKQ